MLRVGRLRTAAATLVGGCALAQQLNRPALLQEAHDVPQQEPSGSQWLWTYDGIQLRRAHDLGTILYVDEASGENLGARPSHIPAEAYAGRVRWPPHPGWDESERRKASSHGSRHIFLVRHAQYNVDGGNDAARTLTELGEQQAKLLGPRLAAIHTATTGAYKKVSWRTLESSNLTRAVQTADLLAPWLPGTTRSRDAMLNEGRPCLPEPAPRHSASYTNRNGDSERIEGAYRKICAAPPASQKTDTHELVVCHANVIRYVVCRALQLPPEAWLRLSLPHASITHIVVRPNGDVSLRMLGDSGHLPPDMVSV